MQNGIKQCLVLGFFMVAETLFASPSVTNSIALVGKNMDYREYNKAGVLVDSEESDFSEMSGAQINFGFLFDKEKNSYSQIDINFLGLGGNTKYRGSFLDNNLPYGSLTNSTTNYIMDVEMSYKNYHRLNDVLEVNYGLGLGYYLWERTLSSSQVELYDWFYLKPALGVTFEITKNLNLGVHLAYKYAINPTMNATNPSLDFTLGGVNTFEASLPLTYAFSDTFDIFLAYEFQQQEIKASDAKYYAQTDKYYYEPDSTSKNQFIKLGMTFKY